MDSSCSFARSAGVLRCSPSWPSAATRRAVDAAPTTAPTSITADLGASGHDHRRHHVAGARRHRSAIDHDDDQRTTTTVPRADHDDNACTGHRSELPDDAARRGDRSRSSAGLAVRQRRRLARVRHHDGTRPARSRRLSGVRQDMHTSSTFGGHYSTMTHFVAFTRGENTGARIAFHTVPVLRNGEYVQPLESVGTEERLR